MAGFPNTDPLLLGVMGTAAMLLFWLYRVNRAMQAVPDEARKASPHRWTRKEIRETYKRISEHPVDYRPYLPPRQDRRYIVVGGSGLVGGFIVLHLLERGQSPESIRIVDFVPPSRADMLTPNAARVGFAQADITSRTSVDAAFTQAWPGGAALGRLPLTVFHCAAVIRPQERSPALYERSRAVNVDGTANVLASARDAAGADVFVYTSSNAVAGRPVTFWVPPWASEPRGYFQLCDESDFDRPLRPHGDYYANYARSKAEAERLVCAADAPGFRTGCVRPGNTVYGHRRDQLVGLFLQTRRVASWTPHVVHNVVSGRNVSLAHLQFEHALLQDAKPPCAGRPLVVTDPNPPVTFGDLLVLSAELSASPFGYALPPPVLLLLAAHAIEAYCLALAVLLPAWLVRLLRLREPGFPASHLQPSVFSAASHQVVDDRAARRGVCEGGIGYRGVETTLEGTCRQLADWNREVEAAATAAGPR